MAERSSSPYFEVGGFNRNLKISFEGFNILTVAKYRN